jgi:hypothetical protein
MPKWLSRSLAVAGVALAVCVGAWTWNYFRSGVTERATLNVGESMDLTFAPDSRLLVSATKTGSVTIWDVGTGQPQQKWLLPTYWKVDHAAFAGDGRHLVVHGIRGAYVLRLQALSESEHLLPYCETILKQDPRNIDALLARGELRFKKGEHDAAVSDFTKVIDLDKGNAAAYYSRGLALVEKGDYARAKADLEKAIQINPGLGEKDPGDK